MRPVTAMLAAATCAAALNAVVAVAADTYPVKPVRLIVPFPPGGPADALARIVGDRLSASLGQSVVIDNRPGAAGNIGMELAAKAAADGHTLVLAPAGNLTVNPSLYRNVPYDVSRDFAPVTVDRGGSERPGRESRGPRAESRRTDPLRQGQPGPPQFLLARERQRRAPRRRAAEEHRGHRRRACALRRGTASSRPRVRRPP